MVRPAGVETGIKKDACAIAICYDDNIVTDVHGKQ